ncbi:EAL domain-containing protein [Bowmanella dokdonensis]|uniref:cyclic-guanylate-specific phosphodiesterase n=2 Tax=Bowmanella dokdonensis TaxID=751969 RepID=A0A939DNW7_9ALTE|nr:EAL domain-containing protein [Bowmanella dokdonensis]
MLAVFLLILAIIVAVTLVTVQTATYRHSTGQVLSHANTSAIVVRDKMLNRANQLMAALDTHSKDFSTKQLIAGGSQDPESLRYALDNHRQRMDADLVWVLDASGQLMASTAGLPATALELAPQQASQRGLHWFALAGEYFLVKAVPVKFVESSPKANAWLLAAIEAPRLISDELVTLTDMQISLFSPPPEQRLIATTFAGPLAERLTADRLLWNDELNLMNLGNEGDLEEYIYTIEPLGEEGQAPLSLLLASVADRAYLSYNSLLGQLVFILAASAILALVAAIIISNGITRPLIKLVNVTNKISRGQYVEAVPDSTTSEISSLSQAIGNMQQGIKQRELEIQQLAYFDSLTGLPNRNQFTTHLEQLIDSEQTQAAVLMMDLDRFKDINDTLGHSIGDQLLKQIALRLANLELNNLFPARLGGDEFGLIWLCHEPQEARYLAEVVVAIFDQPFELQTLRLELDASVGVACFPQDGQDPAGLMQCADIAMYSCKGHHHAFALYRPELNKHSMQRLSLMSELRGALAEGQLQLYYQPKLALADGRVVGVECLVRWIHPVHGFIPPDQFIPLAEQTGAIRELTHWALRYALKQQKQWADAGHHLSVAVNISPLDLVDMQLPRHVADLFREFNPDPASLTLEVTESAVMNDPQAAIDALTTLRDMGVILSIDDFGTGYSSMAQLKNMPVHELKIDKAFVLDVANNSGDKAMVKTLVTLAQMLGLDTVAEGVEDQHAMDYLSEIGCHKVQGFYLSKPLPADQFTPWLDKYLAVSQEQDA